MNLTDFNIYNIRDFTPKEIEETGASLKDVQVTTILKLQTVRDEVKRSIHLLFNGLTTGDHDSIEHPKGLAVDWAFDLRDGPINFDLVKKVVYSSLYAGFKGIGVYWNQTTYSFHTDCRRDYGMWSAIKKDGEWKYSDLLIDPKRSY